MPLARASISMLPGKEETEIVIVLGAKDIETLNALLGRIKDIPDVTAAVRVTGQKKKESG